MKFVLTFLLLGSAYGHELELIPLVTELTTTLEAVPQAARGPSDCKDCLTTTVDDGAPLGPIKKLSCPVPALGAVPLEKEAIREELKKLGAVVVTEPISDENLRKFIAQAKSFPQNLFKEMLALGATVRLVEGEGIGADPTYTFGYGGTWSGSGGFIQPGFSSKTPTRIAVNKLYEGHGAINLFLHEHAHTLDTFDGEFSISGSSLWKDVMTGTEALSIRALLQDGHAGENYHTTNPSEIFAEVFAYHHACPATRNHLRSIAPNVSRFIETLSPLREFKRREAANKR